MIDRILFDWAPVAIAVVVAAFFADYFLTHLGARASQRVRDRWSVEGSYEMNTTWERQIDSGRVFSPRALLVAVFLATALTLIRLVAEPGGYPLDPAFFGFAVGVMLLLQAPILMVHAQNLQTFRDLLDPAAAEGGVHYRRWFVYRQGAWHIARFGILWILLWLPSQQAFFLGGAASCFICARRFAQLGAEARRKVNASDATGATTRS